MQITFQKLDLLLEKHILAKWLSEEEWPFHGNSKISFEKALAMIENGSFDGSNHQTFWILDRAKVRIGMIRLFDLDDIPSGNPLFDIRLKKDFREKGVGFESVKWLTDYLFNTWTNLRRIEANTRSDNLAMRHIFRKCLYVKEGHHRKAWPSTFTGQLFDSVSYAILREDWENKTVTPVKWKDEDE